MKSSHRLALLTLAGIALLCPGCTQLLGPLLSLPRTLLSLPARAMRFGENTPPPEIRALDSSIAGLQELPRYPVAQLKSGRAIAAQASVPIQPPQG